MSVDTTSGWRTSARELTSAFRRAGARAELVETGPVSSVRTFALTDFVQARAARRAYFRTASEAGEPAAVVYCSITAALLWPRPGAIWLDSLAVENRPGRHGVWQRVIERRRLAQAPVVLTMSEHALAALNQPPPHTVVVPVAVEPSGPSAPERDVDVLAYAGNPEKKRLDYLLESWQRGRRDGETLVVAGLDSDRRVPGVRFAGRLPQAEYRALLRRARVFLAAPRREDYGIAPLEALADGCMLVTTPAPGPYPARELARRLDPRLVAEDLTGAVRTALDDPLPGYAERARELLVPFSRGAVDATIAERVLPALMSRSGGA